jgi:hypothetical protein
MLAPSASESTQIPASYSKESETACANPLADVFVAPDLPTLWVLRDDTDQISEIAVGLDSRVIAADDSPRTAAGIGMGSSEAALKSAYPDAGYDPTVFLGATHYFATDGVIHSNGSQDYLDFVVVSGVVTGIVVQRHTQYLYDYCNDQG